jgi:hypothetical protein
MKLFEKLFIAVVLVVTPIVVLAQDIVAPPSDFDVMALVKALAVAVKAGQWPVAAVLFFVVIVAILKKFGARWIPWLATSEGGTVLALATATASVLGAAAITGVAITWGLVWNALLAGATAIGGYVGVRRILRVLASPAGKVSPKLGALVGWLAGIEPAKPPEPVKQDPPSPTPTP